MNPPRRRRPPVRNRLLPVAVLVLAAPHRPRRARIAARPGPERRRDGAHADARLPDRLVAPRPGPSRSRLRPHDLPADTALTLAVYDKVVGRTALLTSLDPANLGRTLRPNPPSVRLGDLAPDAGGAVTLTLPVSNARPAPDDGVTLPQPGVWPFTVTATAPDGSTLTTFVSHIVTLPTATGGAAPLAVGVIAPVAAPTRTALDGVPYLPTDQVTRLDATLQALTAQPDVPLTLSADPLTTSLLAQGSAASRRRRPGGHARHPAGARPDLRAARRWGAGSPGASRASSTASTPPAARRWAPTCRCPRRRPVDPSSSTAPTTPTALSALVRRGVDHVVVPSDQLTTGRDDPGTLTQGFEVLGSSGEPLPAVAADQGAADALHATSDPVLDGHLALAALAQLHDDATSAGIRAQGVAVVVPDDLDPTTLSTFLGGLTDAARTGGSTEAAPAVSPVPLDALYQVTNQATSGRDGAPVVRGYHSDDPAALGSYRDQLLSTRSQVDGLGNLLPEGGPLLAPDRPAGPRLGVARPDQRRSAAASSPWPASGSRHHRPDRRRARPDRHPHLAARGRSRSTWRTASRSRPRSASCSPAPSSTSPRAR